MQFEKIIDIDSTYLQENFVIQICFHCYLYEWTNNKEIMVPWMRWKMLPRWYATHKSGGLNVSLLKYKNYIKSNCSKCEMCSHIVLNIVSLKSISLP